MFTPSPNGYGILDTFRLVIMKMLQIFKVIFYLKEVHSNIVAFEFCKDQMKLAYGFIQILIV